MNNTILLVILSALISLIGTMTGAAIGVFIKEPSKKVIGGILALAAGLMSSIVIFDLFPHCIEVLSITSTIIYVCIGIIIVIILDVFISSITKKRKASGLKLAMLAMIGLMIHNFPEGIIMGTTLVSSRMLGIKMCAIIAIHDIPEGIAVAAPLMQESFSVFKILKYVFLTTLPTVLGAWIGIFTSNISNNILGMSLAIAGGIMIYVSFFELLPEAFKYCKNKSTVYMLVIGMIIGLLMVNLL